MARAPSPVWVSRSGQWPLWVPPLPGFLDLGGSCSESRRSFFPACRGPSHQQMITFGVISRCGNARDQRGGDLRGNGGKFVLGLYRNTKLEDVSLALSFPITSQIQQTGRKGAWGETGAEAAGPQASRLHPSRALPGVYFGSLSSLLERAARGRRRCSAAASDATTS